MNQTSSAHEDEARSNSAVAKILEAEDAAKQRLQAVREAAAARVQQARDQARGIEQRAVERTSDVQQAARAGCERKIAALQQSAEARLQQPSDDAEVEAIERHAERFARTLIGFGDARRSRTPGDGNAR